jgi:hypothetical protein
MSTRTRSRGAMKPGTAVDYDSSLWHDCTGNWAVTNTTVHTTMVGDVESMTDYVIPRFRARVRKGEVFFSPMTYTRVRSLPEVGTGRHVRYKANTITCSGVPRKREHKNTSFAAVLCLSAYNYTGSYNGDPVPVMECFTPAEVAAMQSEVSTKVMANRGLSDSNLFESMAEANKLGGLLTGPLQNLKHFLDQRSVKALAMGSAAAWLTYRYGLKPLLNDIESVLKGLKKPVGKQRKTTRASLSQERTDVQVKPSLDWGGHKSNIQLVTLDQVKLRAMSLDEYVADLASNIGFTGKGLLGLPWELIPFSFVADWFINVGDFLYAYLPAFGYKQLGSCLVTTRYRSSTYTALDAFALPGGAFDLVSAPTGTISGSVLTKTRSQLCDPKLAPKVDFKLSNATRLADAISLLLVVGATATRMFGGAPARLR